MTGVPTPSHVTALRLSQPTTLDLAVARRRLNGGAVEWLGTPVPAPRPDNHRYLTDLSLPLRSHAPLLTFKKAAFVDLGRVDAGPNRCEVEISWQSSSLAPLFPVFAGRLVLTPDNLELDGFYAPPGGDLGAVLDKAFLSIAARGTARWFLERVAAALTGAD